MFCANCGKELREGEIYCHNCGVLINKNENQKINSEVSSSKIQEMNSEDTSSKIQNMNSEVTSDKIQEMNSEATSNKTQKTNSVNTSNKKHLLIIIVLVSAIVCMAIAVTVGVIFIKKLNGNHHVTSTRKTSVVGNTENIQEETEAYPYIKDEPFVVDYSDTEIGARFNITLDMLIKNYNTVYKEKYKTQEDLLPDITEWEKVENGYDEDGDGEADWDYYYKGNDANGAEIEYRIETTSSGAITAFYKTSKDSAVDVALMLATLTNNLKLTDKVYGNIDKLIQGKDDWYGKTGWNCLDVDGLSIEIENGVITYMAVTEEYLTRKYDGPNFKKVQLEDLIEK